MGGVRIIKQDKQQPAQKKRKKTRLSRSLSLMVLALVIIPWAVVANVISYIVHTWAPDMYIGPFNALCLLQAGLILMTAALIYAGTVFGIRRQLRPFDSILAAVNRFRSGRFDEACSVDADNEFGDLCDAFNDMAAYIRNTTDSLLSTQIYYKNLLDSSNDITWEMVPQSEVLCLTIPRAWQEKYGQDMHILSGNVSPEGTMRKDDLAGFRSLRERAAAEPFVQYTMELPLRIGTQEEPRLVWVLMRAMAIYDQDEHLKIIGTMVDINERKQLELQLAENEEKYRFVLESMTNILYEIDFMKEEGIVLAGDLRTIIDTATDRVDAHSVSVFLNVIHPDHRDKFQRFHNNLRTRLTGDERQRQTVEYRVRNAEGHYIWVAETVVATKRDGRLPLRAIGHISNIDERKRREIDAVFKARHDGLTGTYNNRSTVSEINRCLRAFPQKTQVMALIDIDDFKQFNDTYGHSVGDQVLLHVAHVLRDGRMGSDFVGRMGGDEFLLYLVGCESEHALRNIFKSILEGVREGITVTGEQVPITLSIGIASYPADGKTYNELFNKADAAMYEAKRHGKNTFVIYGE